MTVAGVNTVFARVANRAATRALLFAPGVCPCNSYSSLPVLASFLRMKGMEVAVHDLNVEAYQFWLDSLTACDDGLPSSGRADAIAFMRSEGASFYDAAAYSRHRSVLDDAIGRVSQWYADVDVTWAGYRRPLPSGVQEFRELLRCGCDPVIDFLYARVDYESLARCDWIGISVAMDPQLVPSLLTAMWLREHGYRGRVIIGGACAQFVVDLFQSNPDWFDIIDALIVMEGESALLALSQEPGCDVASLPNAVTRCSDGVVRRTGPHHVEEFRALPSPNYSDLPRDRYFCPAPALITSTSRGCYYNRCAFCVPSFGREGSFRHRSPAQVAQDLRRLEESTGSRYVFFGDDCITPGYLRSLWKVYKGPRLSWQAEMRFEPGLTRAVLSELKENGCAQLIFGFESASQRVLDTMRKGIRRAVVDRVLDDCAHVGINVNLQAMVGFPTETIAEAIETLEYLRARAEQIASFSMSQFRLVGGTPIASFPASFSVSGVSPLGYGALHSYRAEAGMTATQASILAQAFYDHLLPDYPVNTFFLDGPMGAHALAYAARGDLRKLVQTKADADGTALEAGHAACD